METERTDTLELRDQELNAALEADELEGLTIQNQRLARIQEYEEMSIDRTDPFAAIIGMGNADLQRLFEHLGTALLKELDNSAHPIEAYREFGPELRLLLKLRDSIAIDLAVQSSDAEQQAAAYPRRIKGKMATSKRDLVTKPWSGKR